MLRTSFESELRTLENLTELTADQSTRKGKLGFWIDELKQFQEALEGIEAGGFSTHELRRYAIADTVHSMARRWMSRLRGELGSDPLPGWQERAEKENLHPEFASWIAEAVEHVDRQCIAVAPEALAADTPDEELTPTAIAELFRGGAPAMIQTALDGICREWQAQFDTVLLRPIREQIKAAEEDYKQLEDNLENKLPRGEVQGAGRPDL
jgi:hypothetical protein